MPQSIYFDWIRKSALSSDDIETLYGEYRTDVGDFSIELGAGLPVLKSRGPKGREPKPALLGGDFPIEPDARTFYIGRLAYDYRGRLRLALSGASVNIQYDLAGIDPVAAGSLRYQPITLSLQYSAERWSLTGAYGLHHMEQGGFQRLPDA